MEKKILNDALENGNLITKKKKSLTSNESMIVKISNLKKKMIDQKLNN